MRPLEYLSMDTKNILYNTKKTANNLVNLPKQFFNVYYLKSENIIQAGLGIQVCCPVLKKKNIKLF